MKTYLKAIGGAALAVVLAWFFLRVAHNALGMDVESNTLDDYADMMLSARELFQVDAEAFQELTAAIQEETSLRLIARRDGTPAAFLGEEMMAPEAAFAALGLSDPAHLAEITETLFAGAEVEVESATDAEETLVTRHVRVQAVAVTGQCVQYFTDYHEAGCVGLLYRKVEEEIPGYDLITLVQSEGAWEPDWQLFYQMAET